MKALMKIDKNAALRAGIDNEGIKIVKFDPADLNQEQRDKLAKSSKYWSNSGPDSFQHLHQVNFGLGSTQISPTAEATLETMKKALDERIAWGKNKAKEVKQEKLDLITEFLALEDEKCWELRHWRGKDEWIWTQYGHFNHLKEFAKDLEHREALAKIERIKTIADAAVVRAKAEHEAKEKAEKITTEKRRAEKAELLKAQDAQIAKWVEKSGNQSQKDRLAEDMLPRDEIVDFIRDEAYVPLTGFPRYDKLKASDICTCEYSYSDDYCDCSYDVKTKTTATPEEYGILQEIKKLIPDATVELREHEGTSDDCENTVTRTGIMVRVKVGAFDFSREYGIPVDD